MESLFAKIVSLLKPSPRLYATLAVLGWLLLIPFKWHASVRLEPFRTDHLATIFIATLLFTLISLLDLGMLLLGLLRRPFERKKSERNAAEIAQQRRLQLDSLVKALMPRERLIIALFVLSQQRTLSLSMVDDDVDRLVERNILHQFPGFTGGFRAAFELDEELYEHLQQSPSLTMAERSLLSERNEAGQPLLD